MERVEPFTGGGEVVFRAEAFSKRFGSQRVLQDVTFSAGHGQVLGVIGPNGAGKTTLLECLAGILPTDSGSVAIDGRGVARQELKGALFYMPDAINPWAAQTVEWALSFFVRLYRLPGPMLGRLMEPLRLQGLLHSRIGTLSKGERKRVLLALALLTPQPVLLLDEPFDGLDLRQTRGVMQLLRDEAASGRTLIVSIHQLVDAGRVCDRLVLLSAGRVVGEGTIAELQARANLADGGLEEIFLALT